MQSNEAVGATPREFYSQQGGLSQHRSYAPRDPRRSAEKEVLHPTLDATRPILRDAYFNVASSQIAACWPCPTDEGEALMELHVSVLNERSPILERVREEFLQDYFPEHEKPTWYDRFTLAFEQAPGLLPLVITLDDNNNSHCSLPSGAIREVVSLNLGRGITRANIFEEVAAALPSIKAAHPNSDLYRTFAVRPIFSIQRIAYNSHKGVLYCSLRHAYLR